MPEYTRIEAFSQDSGERGRCKPGLFYWFCAMLLLLTGGALADGPGRYQLSVGAIVFSDVSGTTDSDYQGASFSLPLSFSIRQRALRWSLGTSYLSQSQDEDTRTGTGDTRLGVTYDVNRWLTVGYKHKFATGSESSGFSTGEDDDVLYLDFFHVLSASTSLFATTGYKWVGEGDRSDRRNAGHVAIGAGYQYSVDFTLLVSIDHNQSSYTTSGDVNSLTAMASHKLDDSFSLSWFINGDSSDTYSAGTTFNYAF